MRRLLLIALTAALAPPAAATAATVALDVQNPGFEAQLGSQGLSTPSGSTNQFSNPAIEGWGRLTTGPRVGPNNQFPEYGVFNPTASDFTVEAFEGELVAYTNRDTIFQNLTGVFDPTAEYELTVAVGHRAISSFPGYEVVLLAGGANGVVIASDSSAMPASKQYAPAVARYDPLAATPAQLDAAGETLRIELRNRGTGSTTTNQVIFDAVGLSATPVPEPAALAAGAVLAPLALRRRR